MLANSWNSLGFCLLMKLSMFLVELCWNLTPVTNMTARTGDRGSCWGKHLLPCRQEASAAFSSAMEMLVLARNEWTTFAGYDGLEASAEPISSGAFIQMSLARVSGSQVLPIKAALTEDTDVLWALIFNLLLGYVCFSTAGDECFLVSYQRGPLSLTFSF